MSYQTKGKDLRVKLFATTTVRGMQSRINRWLTTEGAEYEVLDIKYERHYSAGAQKAVSTAVIVVHVA